MHGYFQQLDEAGDYSFIFIRRFIGLSNHYHSWLDRLDMYLQPTDRFYLTHGLIFYKKK